MNQNEKNTIIIIALCYQAALYTMQKENINQGFEKNGDISIQDIEKQIKILSQSADDIRQEVNQQSLQISQITVKMGLMPRQKNKTHDQQASFVCRCLSYFRR